MANEFTPLPAFNGRVNLTDAYGWTGDRIFQFLQDVVRDPGAYGVPTGNRTRLDYLRGQMTTLRKNANGQPKLQLLHSGENITPTQRITWVVNNISEEFFILFDLLGIFLSLMGPAPTTTNTPDPGELTKRYFLPLVAVYARWCRELGTRNTVPTVVQITWAYRESERAWYSFLGASRGGVPSGQPFNRWIEISGLRRFNYLTSILRGSGWTFETSPVIENNAGSGQKFGNCGETYPFLYVLGDPTLRQSGYGIAVNIGKTSRITNYNGQEYWGQPQQPNRVPLMPPCLNCRELLRLYGVPGRLRQFHLWDPQLTG